MSVDMAAFLVTTYIFGAITYLVVGLKAQGGWRWVLGMCLAAGTLCGIIWHVTGAPFYYILYGGGFTIFGWLVCYQSYRFLLRHKIIEPIEPS